ncbi:MAG: glycosyltransferase family 2 protein [Candidatus Cyclobacteriaceae bacterium M2_1C_046]
MKISGFTFVRNANKLYIPAKESIMSILPVVDEFWIALGKGDEDDHTREEIESIGSDKIKIIETEWDIASYPRNTVFAQQTDIAKEQCSGDWLFYLQCDEAVHEKYHETIVNDCRKYLHDEEVEGILFHYKHFWGDYEHYHVSHNWYPKEIRIIRNRPEIHSWKDAQSFRKFEEFGYTAQDYLRKENTEKLSVALTNAEIYHYGGVRPPAMMSYKSRRSSSSFHGATKSEQLLKDMPDVYDYGPLDRLPVFKEKHPSVMKDWMAKFDWKHQLQYSGPVNKNRPSLKHERLKYKILTFVEQKVLRGKQIGGFKNYKIIRK